MSQIGQFFYSMRLPKAFMQLGYNPRGLSPGLADLVAEWGAIAYKLNLTPQEAAFSFIQHYINDLPARDPVDDIIVEATLTAWERSGKIDNHKLQTARRHISLLRQAGS